MTTAESMSKTKGLGRKAHITLCLSTESKQGRMVDALAHSGDEGRDKLR